jgi:hypothetical protein
MTLPGALDRSRAHLTRRTFVAAACLAPLGRADAAERVSFAAIVINGGDFTDRAKRLAGKVVEMRGYMAPPLKPEVNFFVLTPLPTAVCPFCDSEASWPDDIVLVMLDRPVRALSFEQLLTVSGTLDLGTQTDAETGFVSRVRLLGAKYSRA